MRAHRLLIPLAVVAVATVAVFAHRAHADPLVTGYVNGPGVQCFQAAPGAKIAWQCPGQADYFHPLAADAGAVAGCLADAGFCDLVSDFNANPDPFPTQMSNLSKMCLANIDGGTTKCSFARLNP